MRTFIITRHAAAAEFLREEGIADAAVVPHADDAFWAQLALGDCVVGTLPLHLAQRACEKTGNPFGFLEVDTPPDARGRELSLGEMRAFNARVSWFNVRAAESPKVG